MVVPLLYHWTYFTPFSTASTDKFEHVNNGCVKAFQNSKKNFFFRTRLHNDYFCQNKTSIYLIFSGGREKEFCPGMGQEFYTSNALKVN